MANPYYVPQLNKKLKTILIYFLLHLGVMIPIFGYGQINVSSSAVNIPTDTRGQTTNICNCMIHRNHCRT